MDSKVLLQLLVGKINTNLFKAVRLENLQCTGLSNLDHNTWGTAYFKSKDVQKANEAFLVR